MRSMSGFLVPPTLRIGGGDFGRVSAEAGDADESFGESQGSGQLGEGRDERDDPPRRASELDLGSEAVDG